MILGFVWLSENLIPSNVIELIHVHPYLTLISLIMVSWVVTYGFAYTICFLARHKTIREKGYPPAHCDADGDPIGKQKEKL